MSNKFCSQKLISLFNQTFLDLYNTCLQGGGDEPLYLPAKAGESARIIFRDDYFSSALHEVSHWCIAGEQRRQQEDYGYWYSPDGRTAEQQQVFEQVEAKPQALEWIFNRACGHPFNVSADNLMAGLGASNQFKREIHKQVLKYCKAELNVRSKQFIKVLAEAYNIENVLDPKQYALTDL